MTAASPFGSDGSPVLRLLVFFGYGRIWPWVFDRLKIVSRTLIQAAAAGAKAQYLQGFPGTTEVMP
jgi:hypothetical protein